MSKMINSTRRSKMKPAENQSLRNIPAVEKVLPALGEADLPRPAILAVVRRERAALRTAKEIPDFDGVLTQIRASGVGAEIYADKLPVIGPGVWDLIAKDCIPGGSQENLKTAEAFTEWDGVSDAQKFLAADAQTSGGLLLCVAPKRLQAVMTILRAGSASCAAVIGGVVRSTKPRIHVSGDAS